MAIKGKGKTKPRTVTRAPRPVPVKVKPHVFGRRWVQLTVAVIAGMGLVLLLVWVTNGLRREQHTKDAAARELQVAKVVKQWKTTVDGAVSKVSEGAAAAQTGAPTIFPSLSSAIDSLAKGTPVKSVADTASAASDNAVAAAKDLAAVALPDLIRNKGFTIAETNYVLNSQARMGEGLKLYGQAAQLVKLSTPEMDKAQRTALITQAAAARDLGSQIFQEGYSDLQQALANVGILPTPQGLPPGGVPGAVPGGVPPGAVPSG
jgi:hypothetical protein